MVERVSIFDLNVAAPLFLNLSFASASLRKGHSLGAQPGIGCLFYSLRTAVLGARQETDSGGGGGASLASGLLCHVAR